MTQSAWNQLRSRCAACLWSVGCVTTHVGVYLVAATGLLLLNVLRSPGDLWFWQPLAPWGVLLALHAVLALLARHHNIRPPKPAVSLAPLAPVWTRLRALVAARSVPQFSIIWQPRPVGTDEPPAPWPAPTPIAPPDGAWPSPPAPVSMPVAAPVSWPEPTPTWATSWPERPNGHRPVPTAARPTGIDSVLDGATQIADPERPQWDQLEVAAATWLANRSADLDRHLSR
ncbi:MAG: 2TM domain-containing protein [Chloroflexia bacterium]|nr:2TM domain-containing protein [Chloroflexia bacterium]